MLKCYLQGYYEKYLKNPYLFKIKLLLIKSLIIDS